MSILIENYRGFDIIFEPSTERFSFSLDCGNWKEKQSFSACKKNIDDFIKENERFEPFKIINKNCSIKEVVSIRKDGVFFCKNGLRLDGFDEKYFYIYKQEFEEVILKIEELKNSINKLNKEIEIEQNKISGKTLEEYKSEIINKIN